MWLKEEGFKDQIREWWQSVTFRGTSSYFLMEKIKALKTKLKVWNKDVFGKVEENKKSTLIKVAFWDNLECQRPLSSVELDERMSAMADFMKWLVMEEASWRQKSREIWLKEGDRNMRFFQRMANSHRRRKNIDRIRIGGDSLNGEENIKIFIVNAYKNLLSDPGGWRASPESLVFFRLEDNEAAGLEASFTEEEVLSALSALNGDKAPGPNGFSVAFW